MVGRVRVALGVAILGPYKGFGSLGRVVEC